MVRVIANGRELLFGTTPLARVLLPLLAAALTVLTPVLAIIAWRRNHWRLGSRLYYSLVSLPSWDRYPIGIYWGPGCEQTIISGCASAVGECKRS